MQGTRAYLPRFLRPSDTLRLRSIMFVLAILLPAFALAGGLLWSMELQARRVLNDQVLETARALSLVVDREISERSATLDALAVSPYLKNQDYRNFDRQAREALGNSNAWITVHDQTKQVVNTHIPYGAALPASTATTRIFAGQRRPGQNVTNLFIGSLTKKPVIAVMRRVKLNSGKEIGLTINTFADQFDTIFRDQNLPPRWTGTILDASNNVIARNRDSDAFRGKAAPSELPLLLSKNSSGVTQTHTFEGVKVNAAYNRLPGYGWTVLVGVPSAEMSLVGGGAILWSALIAIALLGLSVFLAVRAASNIEEPVRRLAEAASNWRDNKSFSPNFEHGPTEIRALAAAFSEAIDALENANTKLATQVSARTEDFERIWRLSRDGFIIADSNRVCLRANAAWLDLLGWRESDLVGKKSEWLEHPEDRNHLRAADSLSSGGARTRFTNRLRARNGDYRWFSWTIVIDGELRYCTARDITAEKAAAVELERTQEALRQSQKMDAIGQLTGGVAHDFNNLLTPILGALDIVQRRAQLSERDDALLGAAAEAAERARTLVQRLLAFARRQPLEPRSVDISALINGAATLIGSIGGSRVRLQIDLPENLPAARVDPNELEMALFNLAANARDAMPEGGALRISANVRSPADDELEGCARIPYVVITIADTGCGMDKDTLTRAIEPFFSTKGIGKGTGLGLSMVHGLVAQLGGALTLKSETGAGTSVDLWLPTTEIQIIESPYPENPAPFNASGVVLLVDDEPLVRITTGDMLAGLGYSVIDAGNAQDALNLIEAGLRPRFLITDHLMPDMTGAELAMKVRASHPEIRILIITGYAEQKAMPAGVPSLRKPFLQAELVTRLQALSQESARGDDKT